VLVRVQASSINTFDVKTATGMSKGMLEYQLPVTIARDDLAGVVGEEGGKIGGWLVGL
jgi:NADPH:quinone reductase-like Zn-dependent oxidoreductase